MKGFSLYAAVLLAAFGESTAFIGLVVPGVGLVLGAAVLAARGGGSLTGVALAATLGAVAGFGLSYHLGKVGGRRVTRWSVRARAAIEKSGAYFERFGTWSVFLGHFFGPVRACVAFAAGASGLAPRRFWVASVSGAVAWGFAMAASGAALSGGWRMVEALLGRGSLLVALFLFALYFTFRLSAGGLALGLRFATPALELLLGLAGRYAQTRWAQRVGPAHPRLLNWIRRRVSPDHATGLLLSLGAAACGFFGWLFFGVLEGLVFHETLAAADRNVLHLLQSFRSPKGDAFLLALTYLGGAPVLVASIAAAVCALILLRRWFEAGLLLLGFGSGEVLTWLLKLVTARPRPATAAALWLEGSPAFPSNHAFSALALFGFLSYLCSRGLRSSAAKARLLSWTGVLIAVLGFSRVYLGVHWPTDVLAGYALGGIWLSVLVMAAEAKARFGRGPTRDRSKLAKVTVLVALGASVATWAAVAVDRLPADLPRALRAEPPRALPLTEVPSAIAPLLGSPVETLGGASLGLVSEVVAADATQLHAAAEAGGWVQTAPLRLSPVLGRWAQAFRGSLEVAGPAYPLFWYGRPQAIAFAAEAPAGGRWVARCWESGVTTAGGKMVWTIWLRRELAPKKFLGVPVPAAPPEQRPEEHVFTEVLMRSGGFEELDTGETVFTLLVSRTGLASNPHPAQPPPSVPSHRAPVE